MPTICVSGGFDPIHSGHLDMIEDANRYGDVIVILNSDEWLIRKKGYAFMKYEERRKILFALRAVHSVTYVNDTDGTVCEALERIRPDYFANGGDRREDNTPELKLCVELKIKPLFHIGGVKINSSSELIKNAAKRTK